jgi:hypothetical protein
MKSFAARVMGLMDTGVGGISDAEIISESPTPTEREEPKMEAKMEDKKEDTKEDKTTADSTSAEAVTAEVMSDDEKKAS